MQGQFGDYYIHAKLGAGRFGTVYKAFDQQQGVWVAIKTVNQGGVPAQPAFTHPNLMPIEGTGEYAGVPYLVMPYYEGAITLLDRFRNQPPITPAQVSLWIGQLAAALDALHDRGIVHGDLNLSDGLLVRPGQVLLMDVGQSQAYKDVPSEVYRLAVLAYALTTGQFPGEKGKGDQAVNPAIRTVLSRGLGGEYDSASQFAMDYAAAIQQAPVIAAKKEPKKAQRTLTSAGVVGIGLALLLIVVLLVWSSGGGVEEPDQEQLIVSLMPTFTLTPSVTPSATLTATPPPTDTPTFTASSDETETPIPSDTPIPFEGTLAITVSANVRGGPGTEYGIVARAAPGSTYPLLAYVAGDPAWYLIALPDGVPGWVSASVAELADDLTLHVVPTASGIPPTATPRPVTGNSSGGSNPVPAATREGPALVQTVRIVAGAGGDWTSSGVIVEAGDTLQISGDAGLMGRLGGSEFVIGGGTEFVVSAGGLVEVRSTSGIDVSVRINVYR